MRRPTDPQYCEYCDQVATRSLIWADGRAFIPTCNQHEERGRKQIHAEGSSVVDVRQIQGQRTEDAFGRRASGQRTLSADEDPPQAALEALKGKGGYEPEKSFLNALAKDWAVLRARKVHQDRLDISLDGEKFTLYMRKG
jgi:hypothetical protein